MAKYIMGTYHGAQVETEYPMYSLTHSGCGIRVVRVEHSTGGGTTLPNTLESCCLVCVSGCDIVRDAGTSVGGSS